MTAVDAGDVELASRAVGGSVVYANDELFAGREHLILPEPPGHQPATFGARGQVYDGWETRRRREPGHDTAIVRLGLPGVVTRVVVDTAHFTGNYPPEVSVEGCGVEGYPSVEELLGAAWVPVVARSPAGGDQANQYTVNLNQRFTHVRLRIYPDGGVARLRVHGHPVADPRLVAGDWMDLAALAAGAGVTGCSNRFYSSPTNLIAPGPARTMGEGWETARRRGDGNDWVEIRLAGVGEPRLAELDTTHFVGNAPGSAALSATAADGTAVELLGRTRLQPDTRHLLALGDQPEVAAARLDVYPDGGLARLRLYGRLGAAAREELAWRWWSLLPAAQADAILAAHGAGGARSISAGGAPSIGAGGGPPASLDELPASLRARLWSP